MGDFDAGKKSEVEATLIRWANPPGFKGRVIVPNIKLDEFLPKRSMVDILNAVHRSRGSSIDVLEDNYQKECYNHGRKGGPIRSRPLPRLVGRAVERRVFERWLVRQGPVLTTRTEAGAFLDRQLRRVALSPSESAIWMSRFTAWVTWSTTTGDPFDFVVHGVAQEVRAYLGLQHAGGRLLVLIYELPPRVALHRPTIADAELFPYFQPPGATKDHGLTRPWLSVWGIMSIPDYVPQPRPEGVHRRIQMGSLSELRQLR